MPRFYEQLWKTAAYGLIADLADEELDDRPRWAHTVCRATIDQVWVDFEFADNEPYIRVGLADASRVWPLKGQVRRMVTHHRKAVVAMRDMLDEVLSDG